MYFSVGYPLGYVKTSDEPLEFKSSITLNNEGFLMDVNLTGIWLGLSPSKSEDDTIQEIQGMLKIAGTSELISIPEAMEGMIKSGVVIHAKSNIELFDYIKDFRMIRAGFPFFDEELMINKQELKTIMFTGSEPISISISQLNIWKFADGLKTVGSIWDKCVSHMTVDDFITDVCYLRGEGLAFVL